jgi:dihydrofolate reductase
MWNLISLDGYFEGEKNWDLGFHDLVWGKELEQFSIEQLKSADMLVFGGVTYEGMAKYWTTAEGETADFMNRIKKVVCSPTLKSADWSNTTIVKNAVAELPKLKQQGNGNMFVFGSGKLSETLMKANLFDEYRLVIVPVILGNGRRLFDQGLNYQKLKLLESRPLSTGGVIVRYAPVEDLVKQYRLENI